MTYKVYTKAYKKNNLYLAELMPLPKNVYLASKCVCLYGVVIKTDNGPI